MDGVSVRKHGKKNSEQRRQAINQNNAETSQKSVSKQDKQLITVINSFRINLSLWPCILSCQLKMIIDRFVYFLDGWCEGESD